MIWPILEARADIQKYFLSSFGWNEDIQKSFWNYLTFRVYGSRFERNWNGSYLLPNVSVQVFLNSKIFRFGLVSGPFSWFQSRLIFHETHETKANPLFIKLSSYKILFHVILLESNNSMEQIEKNKLIYQFFLIMMIDFILI